MSAVDFMYAIPLGATYAYSICTSNGIPPCTWVNMLYLVEHNASSEVVPWHRYVAGGAVHRFAGFLQGKQGDTREQKRKYYVYLPYVAGGGGAHANIK